MAEIMETTEEGMAWKQIAKADHFWPFLICPLKDLGGVENRA